MHVPGCVRMREQGERERESECVCMCAMCVSMSYSLRRACTPCQDQDRPRCHQDRREIYRPLWCGANSFWILDASPEHIQRAPGLAAVFGRIYPPSRVGGSFPFLIFLSAVAP